VILQFDKPPGKLFRSMVREYAARYAIARHYLGLVDVDE